MRGAKMKETKNKDGGLIIQMLTTPLLFLTNIIGRLIKL